LDRDKLLALDFKSFDQDLNGGWRGLGPDCEPQMRDLLQAYRETHRKDLSPGQHNLLSWHEGQIRASIGDTPGAITLLSVLLDNPSPAMRDYARATIAFLRHDRADLLAAREALISEPKPDGWDLRPTGTNWPMNLNIVDGLVGCFDKSYAGAYGDQACITAGELTRREGRVNDR
jgi:hypothetical protein